MKVLQKLSALKTKIILGFTLAIGTMVLASFISYNSYKELLSSVAVLSQPNQKLKYSNNILTGLNKAETAVRSFILSRDPAFIDNYVALMGNVKTNIDSFMTHTAYSNLQMQKIDSISSLLDEKMGNLNSFIEVSGEMGNINFTSKALRQITKQSRDSARTRIASKVTTTTTTSVDTLYNGSLQDDVKAKGLVRKIKKLFQGKKARRRNKAIDSLATQETLTQVKLDTSFVIKADTAILNGVKAILKEVRSEEQRSQNIQKRAESQWLAQNSLIVNQIKTIITDLEQEELALSFKKKNEARQLVNQSMITIGLIILICFISCLIFIGLIFNDIAKGNFYRKRLERAKKHAEKLAKIKERFLATMSHEIRTPLNSIIGFSEQLAETKLEKGQKGYLDIIQNSSEHLLTTVNDVLDFSKMEAGKLNINEVPFAIDQVVNDVYQGLLIKANDKGIKLEKQLTGNVNQLLLGDPHRLKQILFNLVGNAVKFTEKGNVTIKCDLSETSKTAKVKISIVDTGVGIPKEKQKSIFQDFNQVDSSSKRKYGGTGLGLSISKKLVELHKGEIKLESELGKGSTFKMVLTYKKAEKSAEKIKEISALALDNQILQDKSVLLVDDDKFGILLTEASLKNWGVKVDKAFNGKAAIEKLERQIYDLIITDIQMPEFSGVDLAKYVRALQEPQKAAIPILALTANVMKDDLKSYIKAGMNDYLIKPFKKEELYKKVVGQLQPIEQNENITEQLNGQIKPVESDSTLYSLEDFEKFAGGDEEMTVFLIDSFVENVKLDLQKLNAASKVKDWKQVAAASHKMLTPFGHAKALTIVPLLKTLEQIDWQANVDKEKVGKIVSQITEESEKMFLAIKNDSFAGKKLEKI